MKTQRLGIVSGIVASVCCLGPPLLILLGLGGLGIGSFLGKYHWYFILGAGALLGVAWSSYLKEKHRCQKEQCTMIRQGTTRMILIGATLVVTLFFGLNAYTYLGPRVGDTKKIAGMNDLSYSQITLPVEGMSCFSCELSVENALKKTRGVWTVQASAKDKKAIVQYDPKQVSIQELIEAVNQTGYKASAPKEP